MSTEREDLTELGRYAFGRLRERLDGLTDEEYVWQPAPGVVGLVWRLRHIAELLTEERNAAWLGVPVPPSPPSVGTADAADDALRALDAAFAAWEVVLAAAPEESLASPIGEAGGPYADSTRRSLVLHILDELIHHGAEVGLVRDLWAARGRATRIMPNLRVPDIEAAKSFYTDFLGLSTEEFNLGWVARYTSPGTGTGVQLVTRDATSAVDSVISIHTPDVEAAHEEARRRGYEIVHPITVEPWGVHRFLVRAPDGTVVNMVQHRD
jgi:predicted enzyme related to lactoylglutathione lyase